MADRPDPMGAATTPKPGGAKPTTVPATPPPTTDPKILLLEEIAAREVTRGHRDDPLVIRLHALITEMKGGPKPPEAKPHEQK